MKETYRQTKLRRPAPDPEKGGMTFRERIEAICRRQPVDRIVFQPRLESWIGQNRMHGSLPERYRNMSDIGIYADLNCSFRPYHFFNRCLRCEFPKKVKVETLTRDDSDGHHSITRWNTPVGSIEKVYTRTRGDESGHVSRFPVASPDDMKVFEYILREEMFSWDEEFFDTLDFYLAADCTAPSMFIPRVNIMRLSVNWMGFENTNFALYDYLEQTERLIATMDECENSLLHVVAGCGVELINYGDNIDANICSPPLMERFVLPAYERRRDILKPAGKFLYAHWDGSVKNLLPYARNSFLDGIEALTPAPQGDVTVQEIKDAVGDMVLVDVLPMLSFMPDVPMTQLEDETYEIMELFAPNLILGVSDEISPVCDIEKVRRVAEIVESR